MEMYPNTLEDRMKCFEEICRRHGIKLTPQRMEVFREVARSGNHPDVESVYRGVRERMPTISLDTVYRTLWKLEELGLVVVLGSTRERTRFDANLEPHHHFVCVECGKTRDFYSKYLLYPELPESLKTLGTPLSTHVEVRGVCHECRMKNDKNVSSENHCNDPDL